MGKGAALDRFSAIFGTRRGVGYGGWFRGEVPTTRAEAPFGATKAAAERRMFLIKWWLAVHAPPGAPGDGQPIIMAALADAYNLFLTMQTSGSAPKGKSLYSKKTCQRDLESLERQGICGNAGAPRGYFVKFSGEWPLPHRLLYESFIEETEGLYTRLP